MAGRFRAAAAACLAVIAGVAAVGAQKPAPPLALNGGDNLMYIGTYAGTIQVFDEATEAKVADIKLQTGIPRALTLSQSRTKFYVMDSTNEKMEIVDIPTRTTLSTFTLKSFWTASLIWTLFAPRRTSNTI